MKLLLDTHILLWWVDDPALIAEDARLAIANGRSSVYFSPISIMEIAIKERIGKLNSPTSLLSVLDSCRFAELALTVAHAAHERELPLLHKDPFDLALLAQARVEGLTLVTRDPLMAKYDVPRLVA